MRHPRRVAVCIAAHLAVLAPATGLLAQENWTYRARVAAEATSTRANGSRPPRPASAGEWNGSGLLLGAADASWNLGERLRVAGGGLLLASGSSVDVVLREGYLRASPTAWMDVEAGKRLLRWGVGYGYSPTGVLDPPRTSTDPTDRLGQNAGIWMARADLFRGPSSLTLAAAAPRRTRDPVAGRDRLVAARLRTIVGDGVEVALIGAASAGSAVSYGGNVTHVLGQQLEWHGELLVHRRAAGTQTFSAVAGLQYTFTGGVNMVLEYHRKGHGLNDAEWEAVTRGERNPVASPSRRQFLFLRAARGGTDRRLAPELIVIAGLDDGGWTFVPAITWTARGRVQLYARVTQLAGPPRSIVRFAPWTTTVTAGSTIRF